MRHTKSTLMRTLANAATALMCLALFVAMAPTMQAQSTIYAMTSGGQFGSLSLTSGTFTPIGPGCSTLAGLGGLGGNLYGGRYTSNVLYQVNITAGTCTAIGSGSISNYVDFGSARGGLYGVDGSQNLYAVNPSNGATTLIGSTGLPGGAANISSDGPALYAVAGGNLYSLNTSTGAATVIGSTGVGGLTSLTYAVVNGQPQLFSDSEGGELYSINIMTGAATPVASTGLDFFGLAIPASAYSVLHTFSGGVDGGLPFAGMILDSQGNLYGTAGAGGTGSCSNFGTTGCGTIFELKKHNSSFLFNPVYSFRGGTNDGEFPVRPLTAHNGTYYGATLGGGDGTCSYDGVPGCGIVFNAGPSATPSRTPLLKFIEHTPTPYFFTGEGDGGEPFSTVVFDSSGNIYGTTFTGGAHNMGTVFKLTPSGGGYTESVVYSFAGGNDGAQPLDGLTFDTAGNLYGTTSAGGSTTACSGEGCGTVFKLTPSGSGYTESVIYAFQGGNDGKNPNAGVAIDAAGNLYGNTWQGGAGGGGTVYELSPNGSNWTFNLLYSVPNAGFAVGRVVLNSGNLYESLQDGGAFGFGQVFELVNSSGNWIYTDLYDFTDGADGANAIGGVVLDSSGNLYGTTTFGAGTGCGGNGCGVVWEIMPTN
jgi:uncharacterized repeat protein (TIGR03803 family)